MRNQGILRGMAILAMASGLFSAPSPTSAATLAGTKQVWQGGEWAVEATPYWCRAYPVAAEKNADGIPAVALIQWDGKVYLEFARPKNKDATAIVGEVKTKIDRETTVTPFNQTPGTNWATVDMDLATLDKFRAGKSLNLKSGRKWSERYSLLGSSEVLSLLGICAAYLLAKGVAGIDPMARVETNRKMQFQTNPVRWIPASAYPRGTHTPEGTAGFTLSVGSDGRPKDCKIVSSSGNGELDSATCSNLWKRAKFVPATNAYGYAIESEYSNKVRWVIPYYPTPYDEGTTSSSTDKSRAVRPKHMPSLPNPPLAPIYSPVGTSMGFTLVIGPNGRPSRCDVTASSGFPKIDKATCDRLIKQARFEPALDRNGQPTEGTYSHHVKLKKDPALTPTPTAAVP
jgi:Gram-negative bacterial TonB protein C-terminal